jgi:hypothetical protein
MDPRPSLVQLSHALPLFERSADAVMRGVRKALDVPAQADDDVEEELAGLRRELDYHLPEFEALFTRLLVAQIGEEHLPGVLAALDSEAMQHYVRSVPQLDAALRAELVRLNEQMFAVARGVLAG